MLLGSSKFQVIYLVTKSSSLWHLKWSTISLNTYTDSREKELQEENSCLLKSKKSSCIPCFLWAMSGMRTSRLITRQLLLSAWNQGGVTLHAPVQLLSAAICQVCSAKLFFLFILCSLLFLIWTPYYFLCDFPKVSKPLKSLWISLLLRAFQFNRSD